MTILLFPLSPTSTFGHLGRGAKGVKKSHPVEGRKIVQQCSLKVLRVVVKKNGYFTVRLTARGGGGSAPSALTVSKCENFEI